MADCCQRYAGETFLECILGPSQMPTIRSGGGSSQVRYIQTDTPQFTVRASFGEAASASVF